MMRDKFKFIALICTTLLPMLLSGCFFTGVESTGKVTEKEIERIVNEIESHHPTSALTAFTDSLLQWKPGKQFYVTDDQLRQLFDRSADYDLDTISLEGKILEFLSYDTITSIAGAKTVNISFTDGVNKYVYRTSKTIDSFAPDYSIPLLIDLDMVKNVADQIDGKEVYIKTPLWYDVTTDKMFNGQQYVPVKITHVKPGNKVLPLKVYFVSKDNPVQNAFVWMSAPGAMMHNRDFDSLFSLVNPRNDYPGIPESHWRLITCGKVVEDMTKEECRLSLGAPKRIAPVPDQSGMREYWYYDGGGYLFFVDGLLKTFRL